jgi:hypothetical protein
MWSSAVVCKAAGFLEDLCANDECEGIFMERFEKIATIRNEIESLCLKGELEARGIPHAIQSNYDLAYDGLFQFAAGWGHIEAQHDRRDEILEILDAIRRESDEQKDDADNLENEG